MAPYSHQVSTYHRAKRARRLRRVGTVAFFVVLLSGIGIGVDTLLARLSRDDTVVSVATSATVQSSSINIFRTEYFQFQAERNWVSVPEASTPTKFVYKSIKGPLVEHQLTIYVNETAPASFAATRVYTVEIDNGQLKTVAEPDKHCNSDLPESARKDPVILTFSQVTFKCLVDSQAYRVFVGLIGGTNELKTIRQNGKEATYTIIYDDLTFVPGPSQIRNIVNTFQIR